MLAQVLLTSSESKRLIGKGVAAMDVVKKAYKDGLIVIIKGTTNSYVAEEILGKPMEKGRYARGMNVSGVFSSVPAQHSIPDIIVERGRVREDLDLADAIKLLGPGDVVVKGANALDPQGVTGVYLGRAPAAASMEWREATAKSTAGTIGMSLGPVMARGAHLIIPVGLEKLIPISIREVVTLIADKQIDLSTGSAFGIMPTMGTVVTEIEAFKILTGVEVFNIGGGGVGGAEGSRHFLLKGDEESVTKAFNLVMSIKGEPPFRPVYYNVVEGDRMVPKRFSG